MSQPLLSESEFKDLVYDYTYDLLDPSEVEQLEATLKENPEWQRYLDGAIHAQSQLTQWQPDTKPAGLSQNVMNAIDAQAKTTDEFIPPGGKIVSIWSRSISIAAALVIIGSVSVVLLTSDNAEITHSKIAYEEQLNVNDKALSKALAEAKADADQLNSRAIAKAKKAPEAASRDLRTVVPMSMKAEKFEPRKDMLKEMHEEKEAEEVADEIVETEALGARDTKMLMAAEAAATAPAEPFKPASKREVVAEASVAMAPMDGMPAATFGTSADSARGNAPEQTSELMKQRVRTTQNKPKGALGSDSRIMKRLSDVSEVQNAALSRQQAPAAKALTTKPAKPVQQLAPTKDDWTEPVQAPVIQREDVGFNPFIDVHVDNRSTFGLDVDSASFSLAQEALRQGKAVNPAVIRSEEFINYVNYHYPAPEKGDFAIHLEAAPMRFGNLRANTHVLRVGLKARTVNARQPITLMLVIDTSGSMRGYNLRLTQRALRILMNQLRPTDHVGIVTYSSEAQTALPPTPVSEKETILGIIDEIQASGSTNAEAGLKLGYDQLRQHLATHSVSKGYPRLMLLSDGVANVGKTGPDEILKTIAAEKEKGIFLTTVGVSRGQFNDALMERLADNGNGSYHVLNSNERAERLFNTELMSLLVPIAQDAKAHVMFNPKAVKRHRLIGYENRKMVHTDFRNDQKDAGEIGAGHDITVLYEVELQPNPSGVLAQVNLRYRQVASQTVLEFPVGMDVTARKARWETTSRATRLACVAAALSQGLRQKQTLSKQTLQAIVRELDVLGQEVKNADDINALKTMAQTLLSRGSWQR